MKIMAAAMALLCTGCTALESRESQAWLALHAVDTLQTFDAAHDSRCYAEGDGITRRLIGAHPSDAEVAAWSIGSAALHLGVAEWLLRTDHPRVAKAWQYVRIGITTAAVADNHSIGIRIGSANKHRKGSCLTAPPEPVFDPSARPIK